MPCIIKMLHQQDQRREYDLNPLKCELWPSAIIILLRVLVLPSTVYSYCVSGRVPFGEFFRSLFLESLQEIQLLLVAV